MDKPLILQCVSIGICFLLFCVVSHVDGIRCNFCHGLYNNEDCNANVAECTNGEHDACYTTIVWSDANTRAYTKGCVNFNECLKLETDERDQCDKVMMNCTYCCKNKSTCNAYNAAVPALHSRMTPAFICGFPLLVLLFHNVLNKRSVLFQR